MPWEPKFDIDDTVEKLMQVFWKKGFAATSLADLTEATGVKRQSLYNTFGNKRDLFLKSFLKYDNEHRRAVLSQLEALGDPLKAFQMLFDALVEQAIADGDKKGCLLVNTALTLQIHDHEIRTVVTQGLTDFERFFERQISLGIVRKDISEDISAKDTAKALLTLVVGIRVLSRGVFEPDALRQISAQAMRLLE